MAFKSLPFALLLCASMAFAETADKGDDGPTIQSTIAQMMKEKAEGNLVYQPHIPGKLRLGKGMSLFQSKNTHVCRSTKSFGWVPSSLRNGTIFKNEIVRSIDPNVFTHCPMNPIIPSIM